MASKKPLKVFLYNTASKRVEELKPLQQGRVGMYSCGPTVYDFAHIGHSRTYVLTDILRRAIEFAGYDFTHVMNITDVGHLTTDDDLGEDKILKGLRKAKEKGNKDITVWDIIEFYTNDFMEMLNKLNIQKPHIMPRATEHIKEMVDLIQKLFERGYAYKTDQAVYFHVPKFKDYTRLFPQALDEKVIGARKEVNVDPQKKHPADFRLWQLDQPNHILQWNTPWGKGFPGWHIECSAMSMKYLGETFDVHTGGEDHIFPHHTNEMAQSEGATGKRFVNYWVHFYHLMVDGKKMSKSLGNYYRLQDLLDKGFLPEHVRFLFLGTHYRKRLNFTLQALEAAARGYASLMEHYHTARTKLLLRYLDVDTTKTEQVGQEQLHEAIAKLNAHPLIKLLTNKPIKPMRWYELEQAVREAVEDNKLLDKLLDDIHKFAEIILNDLDVPKAVSFLWDMVKKPTGLEEVLLAVVLFNRVLGLRLVALRGLYEAKQVTPKQPAAAPTTPLNLLNLGLEITRLKRQENWQQVDALKQQLSNYGKVKDLTDPYKITVVLDESAYPQHLQQN